MLCDMHYKLPLGHNAIYHYVNAIFYYRKSWKQIIFLKSILPLSHFSISDVPLKMKSIKWKLNRHWVATLTKRDRINSNFMCHLLKFNVFREILFAAPTRDGMSYTEHVNNDTVHSLHLFHPHAKKENNNMQHDGLNANGHIIFCFLIWWKMRWRVCN